MYYWFRDIVQAVSGHLSVYFGIGVYGHGPCLHCLQVYELGKVISFDFNGSITIVADEAGESLYLCNKSNELATLDANTELFGFGSGAWALGKDAEDTHGKFPIWFHRITVSKAMWVEMNCHLIDVLPRTDRGAGDSAKPCEGMPANYHPTWFRLGVQAARRRHFR
jgi:hypothetical protein